MMRVICRPNPGPLDPAEGVAFSLFTPPQQAGVGRLATNIPRDVLRAGVQPNPRAWDFLALAVSVMAADVGCLRDNSPDGWTRDIQLEVAVTNPEFWNTQAEALNSVLGFLTGDIWDIEFVSGEIRPPRRRRSTKRRLTGDSICLLSGGVDSLVGAIDIVTSGRRPVLVSQIAGGDKNRQREFADTIGDELSHLQLSHAIRTPNVSERSQRARSMPFIAYGVLAASVLPQYRRGEVIDLLIPENGFVSLNIPLTPLRIGSLSTRTTHPFFIHQIQRVLDASGLHVRLVNPYQFKTKGEMLIECADQALLENLAFESTSCGRFARFNYGHCGRCIPCLVRRAAFLRWGRRDKTIYEFEDLSIPDNRHRDFDDVRSAAFATLRVAQEGIEAWAGDAINYVQLGDTSPYVNLAERGIAELRIFLEKIGTS